MFIAYRLPMRSLRPDFAKSITFSTAAAGSTSYMLLYTYAHAYSYMCI